MTVGEMLDRVSSTELTEWAVYEEKYGPLGPSRHDHLAALVAATVSQTVSKTRVSPSDFVPKWARKRRQSAAEQIEILNTFAQSRGGDPP